MSAATAESQFVVHFFLRWSLNDKEEFRETYPWRERRQIGNVIHPFTVNRFANLTTVRISDGQQELAGDEFVKPGGVYTVEMKETTIGVRVKVNDGETKHVNVPQSLVLSELGRSQNVRAVSTSRWDSIFGFEKTLWEERVQEGASYWIQTPMYPAIWAAKEVAAAFRRLLPAKKNAERGDNREAALNSLVPTECFQFLWIAGTAFIAAVLLIILFVSIAGTPSEGDGGKPTVASTAPVYSSPSIDTGNTAILALLQEMNGKLDAERAGRAELHDRLQRMQDEHKTEQAELLATISKLEERIADLHRVNVSIAPTPLYTCEPKPQLTAKTAAIFGGIFLVLFILAGFCKYMAQRQQARRQSNIRTPQ
ncbi:hypothetical protein M3Y99_00384500 [Aphelenchoides fujianensis]|nr:hypothetical protein M3Y99_00384500 [Aphelenchoides fujianensis]